MYIETAGKFLVTKGTLSFNLIIIKIDSNAESGFIITGSTGST
jgi:hypothetical protein